MALERWLRHEAIIFVNSRLDALWLEARQAVGLALHTVALVPTRQNLVAEFERVRILIRLCFDQCHFLRFKL